MKNCRLISFISVMVILMSVIIACSSDDGDNNVGNETKPSIKRITKIIEERDATIRETVLSYDSQGRIIEAVTTANSASSSGDQLITKYQYGETLIIEKEETKGNWVSDNLTVQYPRTHTYTLTNGLITKDTEIRNGISQNVWYFYDSNGCMDKLEGPYEGEYDDENKNKYKLTWENGLLKKLSYLGVGNEYSYSNYLWPKGMIFNIFNMQPDIYLTAQGYYGKTPDKLPTTVGPYDYIYTVTDGYVTKIMTSSNETYVKFSMVTSYIWE